MNPDSENFDSLRQLLALKRHEIPPPGYFDRFPRDVMARIKAGETGGEIGLELSWPQRFLALFDVKPVFAGAFGAALCVMTVAGVMTSEQGASTLMGESSSGSGPTTTIASTPTPRDGVTLTGFGGGTNLASSGPSLFDQFELKSQPAAYEQIFVPNKNN